MVGVGALSVGFLDEVVRTDASAAATAVATELAKLPASAYTVNKLALRAKAIARLQRALPTTSG